MQAVGKVLIRINDGQLLERRAGAGDMVHEPIGDYVKGAFNAARDEVTNVIVKAYEFGCGPRLAMMAAAGAPAPGGEVVVRQCHHLQRRLALRPSRCCPRQRKLVERDLPPHTPREFNIGTNSMRRQQGLDCLSTMIKLLQNA